MKKLFLFAAAATMLAACTTDTTEDVAQIVVPDCLQVSIADEESRMQLSNEKTVWTAGDKVSVFYKSDANQCWKFNGKTGDRSGTLSCVSQGTATAKMEKVVIVYPYSESYMITPSSGNIEAKLPAVQKYLHGSYGLESSPMISSGYYTQFALKNVCGWLKLQLSGTGTITKISLKGNNGEQLAGDMYINAEDATVTLASASVDNDDNQETGGTLVFEDSIVKEVELNCNGGVDLSGADVTPFYIALPPTVFEQGFTATLHFDNGMQKEISTSKKVEITRNHIVPMEELTIDMSAYIVIKYVTSNKRIIDNSAKNSSWWASVVSNTYDTENNVGTLVIPKGSSIGDGAFCGCSRLTSITIPDSVTSIGDVAFAGCSNLKSVTIGNSVTSIGSEAFSYCSSLTSINIPNSVTSIGTQPFKDCSSLACFISKYSSFDKRCLIMDERLISFAPSGLTEYIIPGSVTSIGSYAFYGCNSLTSINIPDRVTSIGESAFSGCSSLTSINIPDIVTSIGNSAFYNCSSLTSVTIPDSVTSIKDSAFAACSSLTSISIPDSITTIERDAFNACSSLTSINIPDGVISIGIYAFYGCSSLKSINIPDGVTSIEGNVFSGCSNLTCFISKYSSSDKRCLIMGEKLISFAPSELTEYIIPDSVTSIGDSAFSACSSLTSITIPDSVTSIGQGTFSNCISLTSINIPDSITSIEEWTFYNCRSLTSITIPNSVTYIEMLAFRDCCSLTSIYCKAKTPPTIRDTTFYNVSTSSCTIYVPTGCKEAYAAKNGWSSFTTIIEMEF